MFLRTFFFSFILYPSRVAFILCPSILHLSSFPMYIEFNFRKNEDALWLVAFALLVIAALVGMAQIGRNVTPMDSGSPRLLGWSDWQLLQAQRAYARELSILRTDAMQLSQALDQQTNPVLTQFLIKQIAQHTKEGDPSLANARLALENAALNVRDWSSGTLDRDTAILSIQNLLPLLQQ
jgi:hypothetical protein